jgi:hypothetical protein
LQNLLQLDLVLVQPHLTVIVPITDVLEKADVVLASGRDLTELAVLAVEWRVRITVHELVLLEKLIQIIVILLERSARVQRAQRLQPILSQV